MHEQKYDEKYDACEKSELLPEPYAAGGIRIPNLLIRSQIDTLNINDKLSDYRGKSGVGAGLPRHSCRTLP
jgi:hypothetical protein